MQADRIYCGDALTVLKTLPDNSVNCCVTSPPYYALRDYGVDGQIGREETPALYVERLTSIFREVRRVLTPDGTLWLNIADTYAGKGNQGESLDPKYPNGRTGQAVALEKLSADRGTGQNSFLFREILKCLRKVTAYFCSGRDADLVSKSWSHIRLMNDGRDFKVLCGENNWNSHKTAL